MSLFQLQQKSCHFPSNKLFPKNEFLLTNLGVCSPKSINHKTVKFGKNTDLQWDYNLKENHSNLRGQAVIFVDLAWNDFGFNVIISGL
jgi:hypothetical protein